MRKKLLATLLTLCLAFTLLPTSALATVGPISTTETEKSAVKTYTTTDFAGRQFLVLQNDYITFAVQSSGGSGNELYSYTVPTALLDGSLKNIFLYPMEITRFRAHDGETSSYSAGNDLRLTSITGSTSKDSYTGTTYIDLSFNTSDNRLTGTMTFCLERINENDGGQHWGVAATTGFALVGNTTNENTCISVYLSKEYPLSRMGHQSAVSAPLQMSTIEEVYSSIYDHDTAVYTQTLNAALGLTDTYNRIDTGTKSWINRFHTEIYTDSYACGNPFVAMSTYYSYTDGHQWYPNQVESDGSKVITYSTFSNPLRNMDGLERQYEDMFWGFRDLYALGDQAAPTEPDAVTVSGDKLYIIPNGNSFRVSTAATNSAVAVVRGNYTVKNNMYEFSGGAAALSPTVTATWGSGGYFRIKSDGAIEFSGVSLNAPTFKFFSPKEGGQSGLKLEFTSDGLDMSFEPTKNNAVFSLNIPYATVAVEKGTADVTGNLTFSGDMSVSTLFDGASLTLEELGYGLKNGSFTVNGVHATGSLKTANLIGLKLAEVDGEINTFPGKETYSFKLELDVFSLFETDAELELKRLSNGVLMPNNLYFYFGAEPGIPLVPPVPTTFVTGGGAGFYGLADTANGNWFAIPPLKLRGTVSVQFVKLLEAKKANIIFGPSAYEVSSDEVNFAKVASVFGGGFGMYLNGDKVTYQNKVYTGLSADGKIWMQVDLPSKDMNFLTMNGQMAVGIFGGINTEAKSLYMRAYGNSRAEAKLQLPSDWAVVGGWKLAGVSVDAAVVGQTLITASSDYNATIKSAFDNMKLQVGLAGTGSFLGSDVRVWVILPDVAQNAQKNTNWGWDYKFLGSLSRWSWDGKLNIPTNASISPASMPNGSTASKTVTVSGITDDEQVAYLVLSFPETTTIDLSKVSVTKNGDTSFTFNPVQIALDSENTITNGDTANIMSSVVPLADGTGDEQVLIINVGKGTSANGTYTVNLGDNDNNIQPEFSTASVVSPADRLGTVTFSNSTVSGSVEYPEENTTYIVRTYLSTEKNGADYLVDESEVTETNGTYSFNITVPTNGTAAPSGSYYLTTYLLKEVTYTDDDGKTQKAYIAIGSDSSESAMLNYTNNNTPAAPTSVTLTATGNETMKASWSGVTNTDGYKITIYEQDKENNWVDSGYGYEYDANQFLETVSGKENDNHITGLSYNETNQTYSINMAVTMGGADEKNGNPVTLEAGKSYKVGVSAYNSEEITLGTEANAEKQTVKYYGTEAQNSDGVLLPKYTPLEMQISVNNTSLTADEDGIYNAVIKGTNSTLSVSADGTDGNPAFKVVRMDDSSELEESNSTYTIPNFEGTLMLAVTGSVTNDGVTDTTTRYVLISRDDTTPIVTLDRDTFYTGGNTRNFTITGVTEPGATVSLKATGTQNSTDVTAQEDDTFSLSGTVMENFDTVYLSVTAEDAAGNSGSDSAVVIVGKDPTSDPGSGSSGSGGATTYPVSAPSDAAGGTVTVSPKNAAKGATVTITVTPDDGYQLDTLTVTDAKGNQLTLTDKGNGQYTFLMPSAKVTVAASFTALENPPAPSFADVPANAYYADAVAWAVENGVTTGTSPTAFSPDAGCTRAQAVTFLWRAAGSPAPEGSDNPFTDVQPGAYYYQAVLWATENGITTGTTPTTFSPDEVCSRAQIVTFLWRNADRPAPSAASTFGDVPANAYYTDAVAWAVENGVTTGTTPTTFNPNENCTRAQIVTFLYRSMA